MKDDGFIPHRNIDLIAEFSEFIHTRNASIACNMDDEIPRQISGRICDQLTGTAQVFDHSGINNMSFSVIYPLISRLNFITPI
jgi:hypothetical protein